MLRKMTVAYKPDLSSRAFLCSVYVLLCASGPILLDWVRLSNGGRYNFYVPALTFHAFALASSLGFVWTALQDSEGVRRLNQPMMVVKFGIVASLFTAGDMLSFISLQRLDAGTFSLVGKGFAIVLAVVLTRLILNRRQTSLQNALVFGIAASMIVFCRLEAHARGLSVLGPPVSVAAGTAASGVAWWLQDRGWLVGLAQRTLAVCLTSLAAVLQESFLTKDRDVPYMVQQCWMGIGAMMTSLFTFRFLYGLPFSSLFQGFGDWRVIVLLLFYVANGLMGGLVVKRLGALAKALCYPVYLGACYAYAVRNRTAVLTFPVVAAWAMTTGLILLFAVDKAWERRAVSTKVAT